MKQLRHLPYKNKLELEKMKIILLSLLAFKKASKTQSDGTSKQQAELEVFITVA